MLVFSRIFIACLLSCSVAAAHADVPSDQILDSVRVDLNHGRADHGLQALDQVLTSEPQNAEAHNLRCRIYLQEQRWNEAVKSCQTAVKLAPGNSNFHLWLARALGEKADRVSFITAFKMAKQVHQEFETAAKLDPQNAAALSAPGGVHVDGPA